jgi:hypothetical protein
MANALNRTQLAIVLEEMNAIHQANMQYWERKEHTRQEEMEYERRQERLEQIRKECGWIDSPCKQLTT